MFSGAKSKLQQWRQRKTPTKIMEVIPKEGIQKRANEITEHLKNLRIECNTVVGQLNQQVAALSEIDEDTTVVAEKINLLQDHAKTIDKGLQESEVFNTFFECIETLNTAINRDTSEIEDLQRQASTLFNENRKLRTELQIFQDHHERSELRAVELESQVEHLKFMSTLPSEYTPFFGIDEKTEVKEDEEKFATKLKDDIPFFEVDDSIETAGPYILSVLDTLDFTANSRLKILFDLIKSYIEEQAYDIAIPLLKTTLEDLTSKYDPQDKIVFTMMQVMVIVYNVTQRYADAIEVQKEILQIRKEFMPEDTVGLAQTLSSLALLYPKIGKVKTARVFCRQALDLKNKIYGERALETAKELHNMGILYYYDGKYTKSTDCLMASITIIRTCSNKSVFCLGAASANLASVYIQNGDLLEAKHLFNSVLTFLHKELGNFLKGNNISKAEILADENKVDDLSDCDNKEEIKKIVHLVVEVTERSKSVSHVTPKKDSSKVVEEKYTKVYISDEE